MTRDRGRGRRVHGVRGREPRPAAQHGVPAVRRLGAGGRPRAGGPDPGVRRLAAAASGAAASSPTPARPWSARSSTPAASGRAPSGRAEPDTGPPSGEDVAERGRRPGGADGARSPGCPSGSAPAWCCATSRTSTSRETAAALRCSEGTVKSQTSRALASLRVHVRGRVPRRARRGRREEPAVVNDLKELMRENVAAPPPDHLDLDALVWPPDGAGCAAARAVAGGGGAVARPGWSSLAVVRLAAAERHAGPGRHRRRPRPGRARRCALADADAGRRGTRLRRADVVHEREPGRATTGSTSTGSPTTG